MENYLRQNYSGHIERYERANQNDKVFNFNESNPSTRRTIYTMIYEWKEEEVLYEIKLVLEYRRL